MDPNLRPTPETDAAICKCRDGYYWVKPSVAKRLERERDNARENTKAWHGEYRAINDLYRELGLKHKEALRQRDEAMEKLTKACEDEHRMAEELLRVTVQRDRLLEALKDIMDEHVDRHDPSESALIARAAIAEVEGGRN